MIKVDIQSRTRRSTFHTVTFPDGVVTGRRLGRKDLDQASCSCEDFKNRLTKLQLTQTDALEAMTPCWHMERAAEILATNPEVAEFTGFHGDPFEF